jgi:hypothetical protein
MALLSVIWVGTSKQFFIGAVSCIIWLRPEIQCYLRLFLKLYSSGAAAIVWNSLTIVTAPRNSAFKITTKYVESFLVMFARAKANSGSFGYFHLFYLSLLPSYNGFYPVLGTCY